MLADCGRGIVWLCRVPLHKRKVFLKAYLNVDNGTNDLGNLAATVGNGSAAEGTASACYWRLDENMKIRQKKRWV